MQTRRWLNDTQPQTLQFAVIMLYFDAFFHLLNTLQAGVLSLLLVGLLAGTVGAAYGIANEQKWGYFLGIAMAFAPALLRLVFLDSPFAGVGLISLMLEVALIAALLHPMSRNYQRIWFK